MSYGLFGNGKVRNKMVFRGENAKTGIIVEQMKLMLWKWSTLKTKKGRYV